MIVPDVNLLVYAFNADDPLHGRAKRWLEEALSGSEPVGLAWNVLLGFLRLTTRSGILAKPLQIEKALGIVDSWLRLPVVRIIEPGTRHLTLLRDLLTSAGTGGNLTSDAHLAAIAIEHDAEVCSSDADFGRFPGLRWRNPLTQ
ncbi:MAG: type II toxin-antitoxin system VapC family toxin [Bryobacteraceae bacterium]